MDDKTFLFNISIGDITIKTIIDWILLIAIFTMLAIIYTDKLHCTKIITSPLMRGLN